MMPGVVSLPHGWGHHRAGTRLAVAAQHAGASLNDVTDAARVDVLSGNAALSGVPVRVRAVQPSLAIATADATAVADADAATIAAQAHAPKPAGLPAR
jgi:hypothetical protein